MSISLTDDDLALIRDWVGDDDPTDDVIFDYADRGDITNALQIASAILRKRVGTITQAADQYSIAGVYSESYTSTLTALQKDLVDIGNLIPPGVDPNGGSSVLGVTLIRRAGRAR